MSGVKTDLRIVSTKILTSNLPRICGTKTISQSMAERREARLYSREVEQLKQSQRNLKYYDVTYYREIGRPYTRSHRQRTLSADAERNRRRSRSLSSSSNDSSVDGGNVSPANSDDIPIQQLIHQGDRCRHRNMDIVRALATIRDTIREGLEERPNPEYNPLDNQAFRFLSFPETTW